MDRSPMSLGSVGSMRDIDVDSLVDEEKVYVALPKEVKDGKSVLLWVLKNVSRGEGSAIVLVHVHRPAQRIPMMGGMFPVSQLQEQHVRGYRELEREKMNQSISQYLRICQELKVPAEKVVLEMDDIGKGLVQLISQCGISKLVMGAAADKHYSKRMKAPKSKTAIIVRQEADPACKIWFVCKGVLICTRETGLYGSEISLTSSPSSNSSQSEQFRSRSLPQGIDGSPKWQSSPLQEFCRNKSKSDSYNYHRRKTIPALTDEGPTKLSKLSAKVVVNDLWEGISRMSSRNSEHSSMSLSDEALSKTDSLPMQKDEDSGEGPPMIASVHEESFEGSLMKASVFEDGENLQFSSAGHETEDLGVDPDAELYEKLKNSIAEAADWKRKAYEESCKRQKAEKDLVEAARRANASELLHAKDLNQRREVEETLARLKLEVELVRNERDDIVEELNKVKEHKMALEFQVVNSVEMVKDLEEKLSAARYLLHSLRAEHEDLQRERDNMSKEVNELRQEQEQLKKTNPHLAMSLPNFSILELEQATQNFDLSLKIGEGGYGNVFKGFLRNTPVAIKMLNRKGMQGLAEFSQEVDVLCKVRHPNLVTLIGTCQEAWALIYEYLPNGSLEDRLACKDNSPPLTWQIRTRIVAEICSSLIFLHSSNPPMVHGDLKPANILLDANHVTKLGDFGICRFLDPAETSTITLYHHTHSKGTFAYMDPVFLATGDITSHSDVYAFGLIILRVLTGRPPLGLVKEVQRALDDGYLHAVLDPIAGDWPFIQAKQLSHLALRCCDLSRRNRPDLAGDAWKVIEPMTKAASLPVSLSFGSIPDDTVRIPQHFICPISQDIMRDPQIAADGFTYEAEALQIWFASGHDTSPMTNLKLPHCNLIPNRALRSAIQEWQQQHS